MRAVGAVLLLVTVALGWGVLTPPGANACTGRLLTFADAVSMSDGPIYAGHITRATKVGVSAVRVTIDVESVVRGPATTTLARVEAGAACDSVLVGQWGYVVRDVRDPEYPEGPDDLFFHIGAATAREALAAAGLPDTSTEQLIRAPVPERPPWLIVVTFTSVFGFLYFLRRNRRSSGDIREH